MATSNNPFERLRYTERDQEASANWYKNKINDLGRRTFAPSRLMTASELMVKEVIPGNLYLYYYDPKTKDNLPYYDTFPLVYPYRRVEGGFMGYNLHYLPPILRFKVMVTLLNIQISGTTQEKKIAYSYGVLNANEVNKYYEPCIRRYLKSHVMSSFLKIPVEDWLSASLIPSERFVKASSSKVWKETMDRIK